MSRIQIGAVVCIAMVVLVRAARAGGQTVRIIEEPVVSQPPPFSSGGKTVIVPRTRIIIDDGKSQSRHRLVDQVAVKGRASVIDGDTLRIQGRIIHLNGIDAFEAEQTCRLEGIKYPCGVMATAHLVELTLGRNLVCEGVKKNRLGELSAECRTGKQSLNSSMVPLAGRWPILRKPNVTVPPKNMLKRSKLAYGAVNSYGRGFGELSTDGEEASRMANDDNRRKHKRIPVSKSVETKTEAGSQNGEITDISVGGAAIVSQGPLQIGLGEPVELRVENYRNVTGHVVRAHSGGDFAIAFDLDEDDARQFVDDITENDGN
ncbi:MAG: PilZ domain-containing protein [Pseudomonadota bacterium]|nr:PilZ domain-containing protein [Pseudomonadota bacterium]